jgi:hypothetical protein
MAFPVIDEDAIRDKNKADGFARVLASIQVLWFALQCLGRAIQHLSTSIFELSTLAFVFCTIPTFFWWRYKPLDVATTVPVFLKDQIRIEDVLRSAGDRATKPFRFTPLDFISPPPSKFNLLGPVMWGFQLLFGLSADPKHGPITSFRNSARRPPRDVRVVDWVILTLVTSIYLCIHLIGWNFIFPTIIERQLWRSATVILLGSIASYWVLFILFSWQLPVFCRLFGFSGINNGGRVFRTLTLVASVSGGSNLDWVLRNGTTISHC